MGSHKPRHPVLPIGIGTASAIYSCSSEKEQLAYIQQVAGLIPAASTSCSIRIRGGAPGFQPGKESVRFRHAAQTHRNANGGDPDSKSGCGEFDSCPMCYILDWLSGYSICLVNRYSPVRVRDPDHNVNKEIKLTK